MPTYKNKFAAPAYIEESVVNENGNAVGKIRIKPSGILWKPKGQQKFYAVPLAKFIAWVTDPTTKATRTKS